MRRTRRAAAGDNVCFFTVRFMNRSSNIYDFIFNFGFVQHANSAPHVAGQPIFPAEVKICVSAHNFGASVMPEADKLSVIGLSPKHHLPTMCQGGWGGCEAFG